jgi:tetratricopeptide (TPR) repeat protein
MSQIAPESRNEMAHAEEKYIKKLETEEKAGNRDGMADAYGNLGTIYLTLGHLDQAEEMFKKCLKLEEALADKEGMASDYGYLGTIYQMRNDLEQAELMYNKGLKLFEAIGSERMIEVMRTMLTNLKMKKKQGE